MKISQPPRIKKHPFRFIVTPSYLLGIGSFIVAIILIFIDARLTVIPLTVFIISCLFAPFFAKLSFFGPIISKGKSNKNVVALTFDDGPDPNTTPQLLDLLSKTNTKATFFVTGKKADDFPDLIQRILSEGHLIGNHTYTHDTLIMLKPSSYLRNEIELTQKTLMKQGVIPLAFRPPVGITNPKLFSILEETNGLYCVNYNRRACDAGNRRIHHLSNKILKHIKANDIVLLHDTTPKSISDRPKWFSEIDKLIEGIMDKGLKIQPLSEIINRPVMKTVTPI